MACAREPGWCARECGALVRARRRTQAGHLPAAARARDRDPMQQLRRRSTPIAPALAPAGPWHVDAPLVRPGLVPRPRLLRRLTAAETPLAMIVAPAGFGKTTLLAEWATRDDRPFVWLSMEALPGDGADAVAALAGVVQDVGACLTPHVIVVDDAHLLAAQASMRRVTDLACRLPDGSCLAVASRRHLAVPIARLRAHRLLTELGPRELAMTRLEAAMLVDAAGARLDAGQVDRLLAVTEGWPAGLYLAALSIQEQDESADAVAHLDGGDRLIAEYIRSEVLGDLSEDAVAFLRWTSVLGRLTAPLCDAVLDVGDCGAVLDRLGAGDVPIEAVDRCDATFRYHPLLAEALRADLRRREPELERTIHRRAADWHAAHGELDDALRHAAAARDAARAGRLLWSVASRRAAQGRADTLRPWLAPFGPAELRADPALALSAATYHLAGGRRDEAERWTEAAERVVDRAGGPDELRAAVAVLRACVARHGIVRWRRMPPALGSWHPPTRVAAGSRTSSRASRISSTAMARERGSCSRVGAAPGPGRGADRGGVVPCAARAARCRGRRLGGRGGVRGRGSRRARPRPGDRARARAVLAVGAAASAYRGEVFKARRDADAAKRLLSRLGGFVPWYLAEAQVALARAEIRLSDAATARALLTRAARNLSHVGDAGTLGEWLHPAWECADAFAGRGDGRRARRSPTRSCACCASSRATSRSARSAARLHVSTNTVKTQALAVYRKLGVPAAPTPSRAAARSGWSMADAASPPACPCSLTVWVFDTVPGATAAVPRLPRLAAVGVIAVEDSALVAWPRGCQQAFDAHARCAVRAGEPLGRLLGRAARADLPGAAGRPDLRRRGGCVRRWPRRLRRRRRLRQARTRLGDAGHVGALRPQQRRGRRRAGRRAGGARRGADPLRPLRGARALPARSPRRGVRGRR